MNLLSAEQITLLRGSRALLRDASVALESGELLALVGPNGAGKSTLLKTLTGDITPTRGQVALHGRPLHLWQARDRARLRAVVPQSSSLSFPFAVEEVVRMGWMPHSPAPGARGAIQWALEATRLTDRAHQPYPTLSGGEQQRVHLARTLVQLKAPDEVADRVWVLDEPTASLDPAAALDVLQLVQRLTRAGAGALIVLHDLNLASLFADRVVVLSRGEVVASGPPGEVFTAKLMRDVYGLRARIVAHPDSGRPLIVPRTPNNNPPSNQGAHHDRHR